MPTTNTRATVTPDIGEPARAGTPQSHLKQLLDRRQRLAHLAGEELAHEWQSGHETYALQLAVEEELRSNYGVTYEVLLPLWVELDARAHHSPEEPRPDCAICAGLVSQRRPPPSRVATA